MSFIITSSCTHPNFVGAKPRIQPTGTFGTVKALPLRHFILQQRSRQPLPVFLNAAVENDAVTWEASEEVHDEKSKKKMEDMMERFKRADTDGNGVIDREELRNLLESVDAGRQASKEHWMTDEEIDRVLRLYDPDQKGYITFKSFVKLAEDGILLDGKLEEYEACFRAVDSGGNGLIGASEVAKIFESLGTPLSYEKLVKVMAQYDVDRSGQIDFFEFLRMFRDELFDLTEILEYIGKNAPTAAPKPSTTVSSDSVSVQAGTVVSAYSESEFDSILKQAGKRLVVLMATLTWCRPCKAFSPTYEKTARHYQDVVFVKFYGNSNDDTKAMFKNRLKARVTPTFYFFRDGKMIHSHTGANKSRLEMYIRQECAGEEGLPEKPLHPPYVDPVKA